MEAPSGRSIATAIERSTILDNRFIKSKLVVCLTRSSSVPRPPPTGPTCGKPSSGIVTVTEPGRMSADGRDWRHEASTRPPLPPPVPRRDHQPRRLVVPRVQPQPRDIELLLAARGVVVSYETVRRWCKKFAASFADRLRRHRPRPGDKWHMDQVSIRIQGVQHYLWCAVDQDGVVLDILVQAWGMPTPRSACSSGF